MKLQKRTIDPKSMKRALVVICGAIVAVAAVGCGSQKAGKSCCEAQECKSECVGRVEQSSEGDVYHIQSSLPVDYDDKMEWILRYDKSDVEELRVRAQSEEKECDVLFFGSSSIRLWKTLAEDMAPLKVVNRGYGGAMMRDVHYNYHTVLEDYRPRAFVFYCDNDLAGFERDLHPTELFDLYRLLVERLQQDYKDTPIFILSIKFNNNRAAKRQQHRLFNEMMADYAAHTEGVSFVDVNTPLLKSDGSVDDSLFEADKLHVNREGYRIWTSVLKPMLIEALE